MAGLVFMAVVVPMSLAAAMPGSVRITDEEFAASQPIYIPYTGRLIGQSASGDASVGEGGERWIELKLFNLFTVRRIKVDLLPFDQVIGGGIPVGFMAKTRGLIVTKEHEGFGLQVGDTIFGVGNLDVECKEGFEEAIGWAGLGDGETTLRVVRNGKEIRLTGKVSDKTPAGIWVKDESSGIGMLTYVNPVNNNFASLGHRMSDFETGTAFDVRGGDIYHCNVLGIDKSDGRKVGTYRSSIPHRTQEAQGNLISSNAFGVYGCLHGENTLLGDNEKIFKVTSRHNVRPGAAKLRTSIDGKTIEEFDIEIIKTRYQKTSATKSMIVRIVDPRLLEASGGIIHGMSGSPILQNNKMVGALTHVMVSDVSKGYGIYLDFVIP